MRIHRRAFLSAPGLAAWATLSACTSRLTRSAPRGGLSGFDELVNRLGPLTERLRAGGLSDEHYLQRTAELARAVRELPPIKRKLFRKLIRTGVHRGVRGVVLIEWSLEPGAVYDAHTHPHYAGLTLGLQGECRMRNFQTVGAPPPADSGDAFSLRQTQDSVLRPGVVTSTMTPTRDNIHKLHAGPQGVRGLDVSTLIGKHTGFSFIDVDEASGAKSLTYRATWGDHY